MHFDETLFKQMLLEKTDYCEKVLHAYLPTVDSLTGSDKCAGVVVDAMQYSVMAGGKRLRPLFICETNRMYGGRPELAEPFMAALEMIHNYSLVHDDMPAMDNDEYRRGVKTTWVKYGEGMAVLAGDALLNYAYEAALKAFDMCQNAQETAAVIRALKVLSRNAGIYGMVGGQCADLEAEKKPRETDGEVLTYIHKHKTACMIESGFQIGAILAGAPDDDVAKLGKIAENIGIAFQIQDDILDVIGDSEELGKLTGSDEKDGKVTYVTMYGLEKAADDVRAMTDEALTLYDSLSSSNAFLRELIVRLITRTK
jgi:geranylgeranyl diphosphate synthase type II